MNEREGEQRGLSNQTLNTTNGLGRRPGVTIGWFGLRGEHSHYRSPLPLLLPLLLPRFRAPTHVMPVIPSAVNLAPIGGAIFFLLPSVCIWTSNFITPLICLSITRTNREKNEKKG